MTEQEFQVIEQLIKMLGTAGEGSFVLILMYLLLPLFNTIVIMVGFWAILKVSVLHIFKVSKKVEK